MLAITNAPQSSDFLTLTIDQLLGQLHDAEQSLELLLNVAHTGAHEVGSQDTEAPDSNENGYALGEDKDTDNGNCTFSEKEDQEQVLHKFLRRSTPMAMRSCRVKK